MVNEKNSENTRLEMALNYAKEGWAVLPLHSVENGTCTCSKNEKCSAGKHPRTKNGVKDATKDPEQIRGWWEKWPNSNIGLATGQISGRVVLDVDIKKGKQGDKSLADLEQKYGALPETRTSRTASGGWHYLFSISKDVQTSEKNFRDGLDFMAHRGYVVAPPSFTSMGNYEYINQLPEADCPGWLLDVVYAKEEKKSLKEKQENNQSQVIKNLLPNGEERNGEWMTHCPFHEDEHPSFSVRLRDGVFNCFACQEAGPLVKLVAKVKGLTEEEAWGILGVPFSGGMDIPIVEHNGVLARKVGTKDGFDYTSITSFSMEPMKAILMPGEGEYLKVLIKAKDKHFSVDFPPDAWLNTTNFLKRLPTKETTFWGCPKDIQYIRAYMGKFSIPTITGTHTAGFQGNVFVTEEGAIGPTGIVSDLEYVNTVPSGCHLITQEIPNYQEIDQIKKVINTFNNPRIVATVLGWTVACFLKPRLTKLLSHFPILCLEGEPGAGKTTTATNIIMRLWALDPEPKAISEQTKFTFMKWVDGSNAVPLVLEENKSWRMHQIQQNLVSSLIRQTYNCFQGNRGRANQGVNQYYYQAPVVIVGESGFSEPAVLDRMVFAHFSKQESRPYEQAFQKLSSLPLPRLGRMLLNRVLALRDEELRAMVEEELERVDPQLVDRPRHNAAIVRVGLRVLGNTLNVDFAPSMIDKALKEHLFDDGKERKSSVDKILETMGLMSQVTSRDATGKHYLFSESLQNGKHYQVKDESLRIHLAGAYPAFYKYASTYGFEGDVPDETSFKKQLKKEPYFEVNKTAQIGDSPRNAWILNLTKMKEKGLDLPEEWKKEKRVDVSEELKKERKLEFYEELEETPF